MKKKAVALAVGALFPPRPRSRRSSRWGTKPPAPSRSTASSIPSSSWRKARALDPARFRSFDPGVG